MTKLDQVKADLIDIIGERKTVKIKEVSHLARSTQLIDELMEKMGYQKNLSACVYDKNYRIKDESVDKPKGYASTVDKNISANHRGKQVLFRNQLKGNTTAKVFDAMTKGTITTSWFQERGLNPSISIRCLRSRGFDIEVKRLQGHEYAYTLKSPKR
ncbi:hypothetical protein [Moraxella porci]|uniref:hypothetical protein n=1 Tax=Moraxella porci TaxID=1288392 RepID=UPI00244C5355|nr:hypothetical protein [Moraxella porci]MDH2272974.1 hypothetical protein [Moraxella porci]